jgi:hypothetical protein
VERGPLHADVTRSEAPGPSCGLGSGAQTNAPSVALRALGRRLWTASLCACLGLFGCIEEQRYAVERETISLSENAAPAFIDENDDPVFISQRSFELQIRPPRAERLRDLAELAQGLELPFSRLPWVERDDLELQVDYAVENRSEQPVAVMLFVDGRNEFHVYTPGPNDFHQWERRFLLDPGERLSGVITELEMDEIAVDLATVVNGAPNTAQVVHMHSHSARDPRVAPYIPAAIPALVGMNIGVQTNQAANIHLRVSVRVQDHGDRVCKRGERRWELPEPEVFTPVLIEEDE